ncbi:hypothetical protein ABC382_08995 [Lysinibacillus sp. 1P01SD]|uniref:hypothetical protein n=1 Tax=Lysinibacillus sp. 1P01SD TaxID=3132285 RepID=UPI0039A166FC
MGEVYMQLEMERFIELKRAKEENTKLREALREIFELAKHDGISKHLDNCYIVARQALEGIAHE